MDYEMKIRELERKVAELQKRISNPVAVDETFRNTFINVQHDGEYGGKAFWLSQVFYWEIKKDTQGMLCLIPTRNY